MLKNNVASKFETLIAQYNTKRLFNLFELASHREGKHLSYTEMKQIIKKMEHLIRNLPMDIQRIIKDFNVRVEIEENEQIAKLYHSLYINNQSERKIIIYSNWIQKIEIENIPLEISRESNLLIHLAHECYHLLEDFKIVNMNDYYPKLDNVCSEIGAYLYSAKVSNLKLHPKLIGYLIAIKNGWLKEEDVLSKVNENLHCLAKRGVSLNDQFIKNSS